MPPTTGLAALELPFRSRNLLIGGVLLLLLTVIGGFVAKSAGATGAELNVLVALSSIRVPALDAVALGIHYGFAPVAASALVAVICLVVLFPLRSPIRALAFGSITAVGWVSSEIGKFTVLRPRPPFSTVHALILERANDSFPSGHTSFVFSLVAAVLLVFFRPGTARRIALGFGVALVLLVAASRAYLGVHYPSDVVGSMLISTSALMIWLPLWNGWLEPRLLRSATLARLGGVRGVR